MLQKKEEGGTTYQRELHGTQEPQGQRQVDDDDDGEREQETEQRSTTPSGQREHETGLLVLFGSIT